MQTPDPKLEINTSRQFVSWLAEQKSSLAFTTYQAGKIFFIGLQSSGQLSVFERTLDRCMGLYATANSLYLSTLYQIWRWENSLQPGELYEGYDALYVPQMSYVTGDLDVHDITYTELDGIIFANTLFSCLGKVSPTHSFTPWWQPPFISRLGAEDRCHLNGLALREGKPRYVTAVSESDIAGGWREKRATGGCVVDVESNEIIIRGLSMPHSPRWYQDKLWVLNSGTGEFGYVDIDKRKFEAIAFCPGYMRGLAFSRNFALVGLSKSRDNKTFSGLLLDEKLKQADIQPRCGLLVIDLKTGDIVHSLTIEGIVQELYDVVVLNGVRRPMAIGFRTDEIRRVITMDSFAEH